MNYKTIWDDIDQNRAVTEFDVSFRLNDALELSQGLDLLPKNPIGVEIGSHKGASAYFICKYRPDLTLYSVDMEPREIFIKNLEGLRCIQVKGKSGDVAKAWNQKIDFLFIDGDHSKVGVSKDIESWIPFVKGGGIVSGHDYDISEVAMIIDSLPYKKITSVNSWVYQK